MLSFLLSSAQAATWYVDSAATGQNNGTTWANAWTALNQVSGVTAGDTVYISGGPSGSSRTYNLSGSWNPAGGSSGNPITYAIGQDSLHNGTAIFSGSGTFLGGTLNNVVISGQAGDGQMHFQASGFYSILFQSVANVRIAYINFGNISNPNNVIQTYPATGFELDHNYICLTSPSANAFMYAQFKDGSVWDGSKIHNNTILLPHKAGAGSNIGADGIETGSSSGFSIYSNTIVGYTMGYTAGQHQDGWQDTGASSYVKVFANTFCNIGGYSVFGDAYYGGFSHVRIFNNTTIISDTTLTSPHGGLMFGTDGGYVGSSPCTFNDIVIANNLADGYGLTDNNQAYALNNPTAYSTTFSGCVVANNVMLDGGYINMQNNSVTLMAGNISVSTNQGASYFSSYSPTGGTNNNYHLTAAATSLIGQGTNLSQFFTTDGDGKPRPSINNWDVGPYQYSAGVTVTDPAIQVSPGSLDFGAVASGVSVTNTFTVKNIGGGTLTGTAKVAAPFQIVSGTPYTLTANESTQVAVAYSPSGAATDQQVITFSGGNNATDIVTGSLLQTLPGLTFSATSGTITAPFSADTNGFVSQPSLTSVSAGGSAVYAFTITNAGDYKVYALVNAPDDSANSFFINIDSQPTDPTMIWDIPITTGATNEAVAWRGNGTDTAPQFAPEVFSLSAGTHQLIIRGREGNTQFGQISIVPANTQVVLQPDPPTNLRILMF